MITDFWTNLIDGSWVDIGSFLVAIGYAVYRHRSDRARNFVSRTTGIDIANGISLFPLFLLTCGIFSSKALEAALQSNKLILGVAGAVALFAILETSAREK